MGGGGGFRKFCGPTVAQINFSFCKFYFFRDTKGRGAGRKGRGGHPPMVFSHSNTCLMPASFCGGCEAW